MSVKEITLVSSEGRAGFERQSLAFVDVRCRREWGLPPGLFFIIDVVSTVPSAAVELLPFPPLSPAPGMAGGIFTPPPPPPQSPPPLLLKLSWG